jgi:hypothetical protein
VAFLFATVAGLAFGAGIQYLGTLTAGSILGTWTWTVSGMSAPWLVLPFVAGTTQKRERRAMSLGLVVTLAALAGYFAMAHSPMEGVPVEDFFRRVFTMVRTGYNPLWIVGGMVTGPLYGFLGQRWRVARWWVSAALVACALCLEPLVRGVVGMLSPDPIVWGVEVAIGAVAAASFAFVIATSRRTRAVGSGLPPSM